MASNPPTKLDRISESLKMGQSDIRNIRRIVLQYGFPLYTGESMAEKIEAKTIDHIGFLATRDDFDHILPPTEIIPPPYS